MMLSRKFFSTTALVLLVFNALTAFFGGYLLIVDPTGGKLQMPLHYLGNSPFTDYLIPGIVLFSVNGLGSLGATLAAWFGWKHAPLWILLQGMAMIGWISIQIMMLQVFFWQFHCLYLTTGFGLLWCGYQLYRQK